MPIVGQFGSLAGLGSLILPGGAFESIATVSGTGSSGTISFTSNGAWDAYAHLQLRIIARSTRSGQTVDNSRLTLNGGAATYSHYLDGDGASAVAGAISGSGYVGEVPAANAAANIMAAWVVDILDINSTSKNTTYRVFGGHDRNGAGYFEMSSGFLNSTAALTSLGYVTSSGSPGNWTTATTLALYGLRAP